MTAAKPEEVRKLLTKIRTTLPSVLTEYRWAHDMAHGGDRRGRSEHSGHYTGDANDPTGSTVSNAQKQKARRACEYAAKSVEEALKALNSATYACGQAMKDPHEPAAEPIGMDSLVTRAELASSKEAAQRREQRGEGEPA